MAKSWLFPTTAGGGYTGGLHLQGTPLASKRSRWVGVTDFALRVVVYSFLPLRAPVETKLKPCLDMSLLAVFSLVGHAVKRSVSCILAAVLLAVIAFVYFSKVAGELPSSFPAIPQ